MMSWNKSERKQGSSGVFIDGHATFPYEKKNSFHGACTWDCHY